ncbi:dihydrofolate reductase family protein [Nocardioides bruguierae]|uniref:Dihydrofolate reductase family protein n=1 Tax=Nocardioides bruguierae TaxID=2945102 RepID=A0A9X2D924_9ACTN|nr:dihydrofolate reductase family protein [Nocardioides bruguierae]MCM0621537.1 dihydrofolate reductase family protein [Nocardioides bruguierae]
MILGPAVGPVEADDVADHYPWPERGPAEDRRPWVRAMMVSTLDGAAAGADGLSLSVSGTADRAVFTAVRRFADVVLVGGGTLAAEEYGPMRANPDDAARRAAQGQAPASRLAVVSGSLRLPLGEDGFLASDLPPLVYTTEQSPADARAALADRCELVVLPGERVDVAAVLADLAARGLWRVVCEGGPTLLRQVTAAGLLDEADLTFSPVLAGTSTTPTTEVLSDPARFALRHVLTEDGFLMGRYVREDLA